MRRQRQHGHVRTTVLFIYADISKHRLRIVLTKYIIDEITPGDVERGFRRVDGVQR